MGFAFRWATYTHETKYTAFRTGSSSAAWPVDTEPGMDIHTTSLHADDFTDRRSSAAPDTGRSR